MTPESITVSLAWAKKLKEAGWPQESLFAWYIREPLRPDQIEPGVDTRTEFVYQRVSRGWMKTLEHFSAPTAEELLRKLPPQVMVGGEMLHLNIFDDRDWIGEQSWDLGYSASGMSGDPLHVRSKDSFVDACAKMYCLLSEQKLL